MFKRTPQKLEAILSSFTQVLKELRDIQEYNALVVADNDDKINRLKDRNNELALEASHAARVAERIEGIVSM